MQVKEIMAPNPVTCLPTDTVVVAGLMMEQCKCGFLPVIADRVSRRVIGVVTDRDLLLCLVNTNKSASEILIEDCMQRDVKSVSPECDLEEAAKIMEEEAIHRLPIIEDNKLVGIMSIKDIALTARKQWAQAGPHVAERQLTEIIEAIAAAR